MSFTNINIEKAPNVLTGYTSGAGTVAAADTVLQAIQKLNGNYVSGVNTAQPAFSVGLATAIANVTGDATAYTVLFPTVNFNVGNGYATNTGLFTAPITGVYLFNITIDVDPLASGNTLLTVILSTSNANFIMLYTTSPFAFFGVEGIMTFSVITDMDSGDTAKVLVTISGATKIIDIQTMSRFSGVLLC